jgi:magnesium transporter
MLRIYSSGSREVQTWASGAAPAQSPVWLDLIEPTDEERQVANKLLETSLPTRDETSALELSSRFNALEDVLRVNIPSFVRAEGDGPSTPLGFVLTRTMLATIRYADSLAFDQVAGTLTRAGTTHGSSDIFFDLVEGIVDVGADRIEAISTEVSKLAQAVFAEERDRRGLLRAALFKVGRMQRQIIQIRSALLGVSRVVAYLCDVPVPWIGAKLQSQWRVVHADIGSLNEFDQQLSERLQFLLDAILGFINNDQNDIMRVLTVVSVVTVPPMILAGIWGMNFKSIPEYDWPHGYAFALTMIALSIIVPLMIFKLKKWL